MHDKGRDPVIGWQYKKSNPTSALNMVTQTGERILHIHDPSFFSNKLPITATVVAIMKMEIMPLA